MTWQTRRATHADVATIRSVAQGAWRATYLGLLRPETIEAFLAGPYDDANVARRVRDHHVFVADDGSGIAAFADALVEDDRIHLLAIYALPGRQRSGAGTALLAEVASLNSASPVDALVLAGNRHGERFYERRGFRPTEHLTGELFGETVVERRWRRPALRDGPTTVRICAARADDAAAIADICNEGIADRLATLETALRTPDERRDWLVGRSDRHPVIVALAQTGDVLGWASLNPFNPRAAYDAVADVSVYVRRSHRGQGIGAVLMSALEDLARDLGYHKLVLAALARNERGRNLYTMLGFRLVGTYEEQGRLDGAWVDVIVMEKLLR